MVKVTPLLDRIDGFAAFPAEPFGEDTAYLPPRRAETIGRPLAHESRIKSLERKHGKNLDATEARLTGSGQRGGDGCGLIEKLSPQYSQATVPRPCLATSDRSLSDAPRGCFSPRSHWLMRPVVTLR